MGNVGTLAAAVLLSFVVGGCGGPSGDAPSQKDVSEVPASAAEPAVETFQAAGYELSLFERDSGCQVAFEGHGREGEHTTALEPPCRFVRGPHGKEVQTITYDDIGDATVLIVVGTPGEMAVPALDPPGYCGTQSQGLILRDEEVVLSERVGRGRKCNLGEDEKEFWLFSH